MNDHQSFQLADKSLQITLCCELAPWNQNASGKMRHLKSNRHKIKTVKTLNPQKLWLQGKGDICPVTLAKMGAHLVWSIHLLLLQNCERLFVLIQLCLLTPISKSSLLNFWIFSQKMRFHFYLLAQLTQRASSCQSLWPPSFSLQFSHQQR